MIDKSEEFRVLKADCIACRKCSIGGCVYEDCPGNVFSNMSLRAKIMVIGQNPGAVEVQTGRPFVGPSGENFDEVVMEVLGVDRSAFYITNIVKCFTPNNRSPRGYEIDNCQEFLEREIAIVKPEIVITLGSPALRQMTGVSGITKHHGEIIPSPRYRVNVLPLFHPSPLNFNDKTKRAAFCQELINLKRYL